MSPEKTIIFIADVRKWAFDNIAQYVKSILKGKYDCHIIYTKDFKNHQALEKALRQYPSIDFIHFFYRGYLTAFLKTSAAEYNTSSAKPLTLLQAAVTTGIPDHLLIEDEATILYHRPTFEFVDNYYTTSTELYNIYANIPWYPKPGAVIYDNILLPEESCNINLHHDELAVTWIGNSIWGKWYNLNYDYKGLETVVMPALNQLAQEGNRIKKYIVDKAIKEHSASEVHKILKETDILIIASIQEGTPLPLIEAMCYGCAVITTDVGIAKEILPPVQSEFVINRNYLELVKAIQKLDNNRELLTAIKQQNLQAYEKIFRDQQKFQNLWIAFIENSLNLHKQRVKEQKKQQVLRNIKLTNNRKPSSAPIYIKFVKYLTSQTFIKKTAVFLLRYSWFKWIIKKLLTIFQSRVVQNDYERLRNFIIYAKGQEQDNSNIYAIYANSFPGVAHSTKELFAKAIPFPLDVSNGWMKSINVPLTDRVITKIARLFIDSEINKLIISGGYEAQRQLVEKMHEIKKDKAVSIYFLWHGSPAQWVDSHHSTHFYKWLSLYKQNKIKAIITLKKGLEQTLPNYGVRTYLLQNLIPKLILNNPAFNQSGNFRIGIWSAYTIWVKNLYPQLIALSMLKDKTICYTNFNCNQDKYTSWLMQDIETRIFPMNLSRQKLLNLMVGTDLTLYVTNTECSPMIALESLAVGVPCLVGPTSALYEGEFLEDLLTVNRVDCPLTIFRAIEKIRQNMSLIKAELPSFIERYNKKALSLKEALSAAIENDSL